LRIKLESTTFFEDEKADETTEWWVPVEEHVTRLARSEVTPCAGLIVDEEGGRSLFAER
jgi:hypothetical protein